MGVYVSLVTHWYSHNLHHHIKVKMEEDDNLIDYNQWVQTSFFGLEPDSFNLVPSETYVQKSVLSSQLSAKSEVKNPFFADAV